MFHNLRIFDIWNEFTYIFHIWNNTDYKNLTAKIFSHQTYSRANCLCKASFFFFALIAIQCILPINSLHKSLLPYCWLIAKRPCHTLESSWLSFFPPHIKLYPDPVVFLDRGQVTERSPSNPGVSEVGTAVCALEKQLQRYSSTYDLSWPPQFLLLSGFCTIWWPFLLSELPQLTS